MFVFGSGVLMGIPQQVDETPLNFGLIQSCSVKMTTTLKELYGQYNYPVAVGAAQRKIECTAKMAKISGKAFAAMYFGASSAVGTTATAYGEAQTVPATSTYTITVTNSGTYIGDLGVLYAATGLPLNFIGSASLTAAGQYKVDTSTGIYTFYSGDASAALLISYTYTQTSYGASMVISQSLIGPTINFGAHLYAIDPTTGLPFSLRLANCVASSLNFATALDNFTIPDMAFQAYATAGGYVGRIDSADAG